MAPEPGTPPDALRRGRGLKLSTHAPLPEAAVPEPSGTPLRRGHGLQLSTAASAPPTLAELEARFPVQHIPVGGQTLAYRQGGDGPPLLLLHGWGASSRYWLGTLARLGATHTCYAPDLPGFGESPPLAGAASITQLAALMGAFAGALGLEQFDLNGHSFGASVAICLAAQQPARVRRLVVTSFGVRPNSFERAWLGLAQNHASLALAAGQPLVALARPWLRPLGALAAHTLGTSPFAATLAGWYVARLPEDPTLLQAGSDDMARMDIGAHLACVASIGDPALVAALRAVQAPTLFIGGDRDRVASPAELRAASDLVPGSAGVVIAQCGHLPMVEQEAAYHRALAAFLRGGETQ